jgi:hypothetical protein
MFRFGIFLITLSFLPWMLIPCVLWLPTLNSATDRAGGVAGLIGLAEFLFWAGVLLAGKDTWKIIKLNGWKKVPKRLFELLKTGR